MDRKVNSSRSKRRAWRSSLSFLATVAALLSPSAAFAQDKTFYLDRLKIGGAPDDGIGVWRPQMGEATRFFGQFGLGFALNPFRVANYVDQDLQRQIMEDQNGPPVSAQLITYFSGGVEIVDRLSFQVSFPLAYESGHSMTNEQAGIRQLGGIEGSEIAPLDLRLDGRFIVFRNETRSFKLALQGAVWLPTGGEYAFGGDSSTSGSVGLAAEYDAKKFQVVLNTGFHFRPGVDINEFKVRNEITYAVGAFVPLKEGRFRVGAEVFGSLGVGDGTFLDVDNTPVEWMVEGRMGLGPDPSHGWVGLGAGTRISAGYAPDLRVTAVVGGWFGIEDSEAKNNKGFVYKFPPDSDGDRLPDDIDMCPTDKEDKKGQNPDDGCPELLNDADSDGVPDSQDACPKEPGVRNPDPAKNGCPEFIRRIKGSAQIEVLQEVQFAFDRADLLPAAFPILNEVVRLLRVNPDIELVSIEGHTDDVGAVAHNDELSQDRAQSVVNYLVKRGIKLERLQAKGLGMRRPIGDNKSAEGRAKNRRVEFHILKIKGQVVAPDGTTQTPATPVQGGAGSTAPAPGGATPAGQAAPPQGAAPTTAPGAPGAPQGAAAPAGPAAPGAAPKGGAAPAAPAAPGAAPKGSAAPAAPTAPTAPGAAPKGSAAPAAPTAPGAAPKGTPAGPAAPTAPGAAPKATPTGPAAPTAPGAAPKGSATPAAPAAPKGAAAPPAPAKGAAGTAAPSPAPNATKR